MKRHNITKKDLKKKIHFNIGIPDSLSEKILNFFFEIIVEGLLKDGEVKISNFGKFKLLNKKERIGRNPKTKKEAIIDARRVISFRASKELKRRVNS